LERAKIGGEPVFKFSTACLTPDKYKQKPGASEKRDGNCHVCVDTPDKICLLSYWQMGIIGAFPRGFPTPYKNCP
jgi:hypothetical protein